jgi:hypothetical protein
MNGIDTRPAFGPSNSAVLVPMIPLFASTGIVVSLANR